MASIQRVANDRPGGRTHSPAVVVLAAVGIGVGADCWMPFGVGEWLAVAAALLVGWFVLWRAGRLQMAAIVLLLSIAATGACWRHDRWNVFGGDDIGLFADRAPRPACLEATVLSSPRRLPAQPPSPLRAIPLGDQVEMTVRVGRIRDGAAWRSASGKALVRVNGKSLDVRAGDRVLLFASMSRTSAPQNPGQTDFSMYARSNRRLCMLRCEFPDCAIKQADGSMWSVTNWLGALRDRGNGRLRRYVGREQAGLAGAVLLGAREQLSEEQTEAFFLTGSIHLLAISGLHVGILVSGFWLAARLGLVGRKTVLIAAIVFVVFYALLTDARPPVVRAAALVVLVCVARLMERNALSFNSLAIAGVGVFAYSPGSIFQPGVQLSFLAVATLACCYARLAPREPGDPLDRLIARTRPWPVKAVKRLFSEARRVVLASALVWLVALPLVMYHFHLAAPVALLLNPILWLPVSIALFCGFGVLVFGWFAPPVAAAFGWGCDRSLALIEWFVDLALLAPGGQGWTFAPPLWWLVVFYALMGVLACWRLPRRWQAASVAVCLAAGFAAHEAQAWRPEPQRLDCTFLSVGHGTCVVLQLPGGETLLYDAGRLGSPAAGGRAAAEALWANGVRRVDAVVVSHADIDHYNSLPELINRVDVGAVYISPVMARQESASVEALTAALENKGIPLREIRAGDRLRNTGDVRIEVLHPTRRGVIGSDNANSIVLSIQFNGRRILLPGDLESPGLEDVMAEEPLDYDIAMAPHHGSARSNPAGFAGWASPEFIIISGGPNDKNPQVEQAFHEAGAKVLHTADTGAIRASIMNRELRVETWDTDRWKAAR